MLNMLNKTQREVNNRKNASNRKQTNDNNRKLEAMVTKLIPIKPNLINNSIFNNSKLFLIFICIYTYYLTNNSYKNKEIENPQ